MPYILSAHVDRSLNPEPIPKLAVGEFLHFDKYAYASISGNSEVYRPATCLHLAIQSQAGVLAVTVQDAEQQQLHIGFWDSSRSSCPECTPASFVFCPVAELADDVMHEI